MRSGGARHFVKIQRKTDTRTEAGGFTEAWTTIGTAFADIMPMRMREIEQADQLRTQANQRVMMWWPGFRLRSKDRLEWDDDGDTRVLNIVSVSDVRERHLELELLCREDATNA